MITIFYGFTFILIDFIDTPTNGLNDVLSVICKWAFFSSASFILLYFLSSNKYIFSFLFPILTLCCTVLAYFKLTMHVQLTQVVLDLAVVNDFRTSIEAVSWLLVVIIIIALFISIYLVIYRFKKISLQYWWIHLIGSGIILLILNYFAGLPLSRHTPYSIYYSVVGYFENKRIIETERPLFNNKSICKSDTLTVVFVLGESLKSNHLEINGYNRHTTPYLMKEKNIISFPNIYSEYGYTHESVPYIMTRANHKNPNLGYKERSFISILKQTGYKTTWLANQETINTFAYFMNECDSIVYISNGKNLFIYNKWLDEDIIPHYKRILNEPNKRNFLLVHTVGSHWYYNNHYSEAFQCFQPITKSKVISSNTHEEMVNSYDNTIVYSDYIWHLLINELKDKNAILIYLADHSENLGEDGHYTHGDGDWPTQHQPGCFVWYSDQYQQKYPEKIKALKRNKEKLYNTSFLFHSILTAADVESVYINKSENIFQ